MEASLVQTGAMIGAALACFLIVAVPTTLGFFGLKFFWNRRNGSDGGDE
ncbi:MAG: hypothetical protein GY947_23290 [Rhodobacteraceae bacterium]|nr:hypothetical protein [Paracoccaceae bacterium]